MSAPAISATTRYINKGVTKVIYCASIANKAAPTRLEINAGTDLSGEVMELDGWTVDSAKVETPDLANTFTGSIPGSTSADDSSLTMYNDIAGSDVRTLLPRNTAGYILIMDGGDTAGRKMDVFPVRVGSVGKKRGVKDDPAVVELKFYITSAPAEDVTIPA